MPQELVGGIEATNGPGALADIVASYVDVKPEEKQDLLETTDVSVRMEKLSRILAHRIEVLRLSQEIGQQTKASLDERQREILLREQLAAIQKKLGEGEEGKAVEIAELSDAITKANMPEGIDEQARKELRRLERMPEAAAEYGMVRSYLEWLIDLPWKLPEEAPANLHAIFPAERGYYLKLGSPAATWSPAACLTDMRIDRLSTLPSGVRGLLHSWRQSHQGHVREQCQHHRP
jgi:ATP-dependent Lon protease